jgi:hypothetical protein
VRLIKSVSISKIEREGTATVLSCSRLGLEEVVEIDRVESMRCALTCTGWHTTY